MLKILQNFIFPQKTHNKHKKSPQGSQDKKAISRQSITTETQFVELIFVQMVEENSHLTFCKN